MSYKPKCINSPDQLYEEILLNLNNIKDINRYLKIILDNFPDKSLIILNKIKSNYDNPSFIALSIQILCANNLFEEAIEIYANIPINKRKKRFVMPLYYRLIEKSKKDAFLFLKSEIYNKFIISEDDVCDIYCEEYKDEILQILSDNEVIIDKIIQSNELITFDTNTCPKCNCKINKFSLSDNEIKSMKHKFKISYFKEKSKDLSSLEKQLKNNSYDTFIDGNNILFFKDRKVNLESFIRLNKIYELLEDKKCLIFLHIRHKKNLNKSNYKDQAKNILNKLPIFYTPYKMNDDWFFIWASLTVKNSYLVTNDKLRDHIFKLNDGDLLNASLTKWVNNYVINYEFEKSYKLIIPKDYSVKIQRNDNGWHIPVSDDKWICI